MEPSKCVEFIHVGKAGGNSLQAALWQVLLMTGNQDVTRLVQVHTNLNCTFRTIINPRNKNLRYDHIGANSARYASFASDGVVWSSETVSCFTVLVVRDPVARLISVYGALREKRSRTRSSSDYVVYKERYMDDDPENCDFSLRPSAPPSLPQQQFIGTNDPHAWADNDLEVLIETWRNRTNPLESAINALRAPGCLEGNCTTYARAGHAWQGIARYMHGTSGMQRFLQEKQGFKGSPQQLLVLTTSTMANTFDDLQHALLHAGYLDAIANITMPHTHHAPRLGKYLSQGSVALLRNVFHEDIECISALVRHGLLPASYIADVTSATKAYLY